MVGRGGTHAVLTYMTSDSFTRILSTSSSRNTFACSSTLLSNLLLSTCIQPLSKWSNCCRSRKCIRWHIPVHAILPFFIYFSYLFYLGHLSLLGLQTKTRRQRNSSTFCSLKSHNLETFMSSTATAFVHATLKRSQKVPRVKSGTFWFPRMDSHDSSTIPVALVLLYNIRLE